ncbi:hypothetical protein MLD38_012960 [Melastoma candidum]|nr:hypothetical protein MLD38_012960 [Melastoma candidum]
MPRVGYGLDRELRRAGVYVRTVEDRPQAADWAVKRQMEHKMRSGGVHWLVLVSDDRDFADMVRKAREAKVGTLVVGDRDGALGGCADLWLPWSEVESGQVRKEDLVIRRRVEEDEVADDGGFFSISVLDEDSEALSGELDGIMDEAIGRRSEFGGVRISMFSEGEEEEEIGEWGSEGDDGNDYLLDSDDEISVYGL